MRTSLNIPQEVLDAFDETWQEQGLESRSRAGREAIHEYIERHTSLEAVEGDVVATVSFDYEHTLVVGELHEIQHDFGDVISTTHHMHQGEWCLESIFCSGPAEQIRRLVYELRDFDAVGRVNVTFMQPTSGATDEDDHPESSDHEHTQSTDHEHTQSTDHEHRPSTDH